MRLRTGNELDLGEIAHACQAFLNGYFLDGYFLDGYGEYDHGGNSCYGPAVQRLTYSLYRVRVITCTCGTGTTTTADACLHGQHEYCASMIGVCGEKRPGRCKFCDAQCVCTECDHNENR